MIAPLAARRLLATALAVALLLPFPSGAQTVAPAGAAPPVVAAPTLKPAAPAAAPAAVPRPWLYEHSDVPMDPAWHFGVLPNGLRYAIRRNEVPAGQVSIRVRVDVGSLMESPLEAGYAHFIEHLSFRGSKEVPDGESKRIWQRLGANFGTDSNAQTTPTGTTYAVDLPFAQPDGLDESLKILAGMISAPNIVPAAVEAERAVVTAERREGLSPNARLGDEVRRFYFAGQPLGDHSTIGTEATLKSANVQGLRIFHDRWYRPERTVVAISGDADPAMLEQLVAKHFGSWKVEGKTMALPDFGKPNPKLPASRVIVEPNTPNSISLAFLRRWQFHDDTIAFNQSRLADDLALSLINRRLESVALRGASFLQASVVQDNSSRSTNATFVNIIPVGSDWEKALREVRAIIEDARQTPPSKADIEREYAAMELTFAQRVASAAIESSAQQAEDMVGAVDIRETVVSPQAQLDIYRGSRSFMTPEQLRDSTRRMFTGDAVRTLLTLKTPQPTALAKLDAALKAPVVAARNVRLNAKPVDMASLPALPAPGKVGTISKVGPLGIEQITFENGTTLYLLANKAEPGKVRINVRFGHGQQSFSPEDHAALWAAPFALMASGIGDLDQRAIDELTNGRQLTLDFGIDEDAFTLSGVSSPQDYKDQLRLYAAKLAFPRWDAAPLARSIAILKNGYDPVPSSASEALDKDVNWLLRDKDQRLAPAVPADAAELTLDKFKAVWAPRLATGPLEVQVFGDVNRDEAIAAVAATLGALPQRPDTITPAENKQLRFPGPIARPVVLTHSGTPEQAAAAIAWPTGGGVSRVRESRRLDMLARIINDRLFEKLRSIDGAAYTPSADSIWPQNYDMGGYLLVSSQLKPERIPYFFSMINEVVTDLANNPVSADELARQVEPVRQLISRASGSNAYWMNQLEGLSRDPRKIAFAASIRSDMVDVTPADLQALARQYLTPGKSWSAIILAKGVAVPVLAKPQVATAQAPTAAASAPRERVSAN